jgi:NADH-quinone oxidoreductase subunit C
MKNDRILNLIKENFSDAEIKIIDDQQFSVTVSKDLNSEILSFLQMHGYEELALLTAVDQIKENKFEVVYILFSYEESIQILVKCKVDRDNPKIQSVHNLWPIAKTYERDVHEFFGIEFIGNDELKPFFLHNWLDMPPMRKDFDTLEYSRRAFKIPEEKESN